MVRSYSNATLLVYTLPGSRAGSGAQTFGHHFVTITGDTSSRDFGDSLSQGSLVAGERPVEHRRINGALFPASSVFQWRPEGLVLRAWSRVCCGELYFKTPRHSIGSIPSTMRGHPSIQAHAQGNAYWVSIGSNGQYSLSGCLVLRDESSAGGEILCRVRSSGYGKYPSRTDKRFLSDLSQSTVEERVRPVVLRIPGQVPVDALNWTRLLPSVISVPRLGTSKVIAAAVDKISDGVPNFYESVPGFAGLQSQISDTVASFGKVLSRTAGPKDLAGQYLSYLYGYRQLPDEAIAVMSDIRRLATAGGTTRRVLRAGDSDVVNSGPTSVSRSAFAKIAFSPLDNPLANWYRSTVNSGWAPTASNWWETVPFSFVVDWFTNIGDYLASASTRGRWSTYRVHSLCASDKWVARIPVDGNGVVGFLVDKRYSRKVSFDLPEYDFSLLSSLSPRHTAEAAALLVVNN